jgi:hypothetical protein
MDRTKSRNDWEGHSPMKIGWWGESLASRKRLLRQAAKALRSVIALKRLQAQLKENPDAVL